MSSSTVAAQPTNASWQAWLCRFCWLALLMLALFLSVPHLNDYAWNYDEGPLLQTAALTNAGYPLFTETVFNKPPVLIWWLALAFKVGGTAVSTARLSLTLFNLIGLAALGWLASAWWQQRCAGPLAMGLWLLFPNALARLGVAMNDLPGMTLFLLTLVALTRFRQTEHMVWTAVSGFLFGLTLGVHPLLLFTVVPLLWLLLGGQSSTRVRLKTVLIFSGMAGGATAVWLLPSYSEAFVRWVITYNSAELGPDLQAWAANNISTMARYLLLDHWHLLLLALLTLPRLWQTTTKWYGVTAVLWLLSTLFALSQLSPMWPHYLIFTSYPLVLLAAGGLATLGQTAGQGTNEAERWRYLRPIHSGAILGVGLLLLITYASQPTHWPDWSATAANARHFLAEQPAHSMAIGDDQFILFAAGRLTPPPLAETSSKRISTGFLTVPEIINGRFAYNVTEFVFTNGRFNQLPDLQTWVKNEAAAQTNFDSMTIYQLKPLPERETTAQSSLGTGVLLNGYTLTLADTTIEVSLFWETAVAQTESLHRFVHLLDDTGTIAAQVDGIPLAGWLPTNQWQPGIPIIETLTLPLPTTPGHYRLVTGLYTFPQIQRLPASQPNGERWPNDAILLQEINIP
ncbi:MAG: hypothetical protein KC445_11035 [Anaerolineales bacterium]|nr:hypothetical protein [Anaerolineales bacterium]